MDARTTAFHGDIAQDVRGNGRLSYGVRPFRAQHCSPLVTLWYHSAAGNFPAAPLKIERRERVTMLDDRIRHLSVFGRALGGQARCHGHRQAIHRMKAG